MCDKCFMENVHKFRIEFVQFTCFFQRSQHAIDCHSNDNWSRHSRLMDRYRLDTGTVVSCLQLYSV